MLVLTRKVDESIIIGDNVKVTVVGVRGDQVKLGIEAPREIPVHREEIYREIQEENRRAALHARGVDLEKLASAVQPEAPAKEKVPPKGEGGGVEPGVEPRGGREADES